MYSCFGLYLAMCYAYCFILEPSKFCHPKDGKALVMNLQVVSLLSVVVATSGVKITDYHERLARLTNNMKIDVSKTQITQTLISLSRVLQTSDVCKRNLWYIGNWCKMARTVGRSKLLLLGSWSQYLWNGTVSTSLEESFWASTQAVRWRNSYPLSPTQRKVGCPGCC